MVCWIFDRSFVCHSSRTYQLFVVSFRQSSTRRCIATFYDSEFKEISSRFLLGPLRIFVPWQGSLRANSTGFFSSRFLPVSEKKSAESACRLPCHGTKIPNFKLIECSCVGMWQNIFSHRYLLSYKIASLHSSLTAKIFVLEVLS